MVRSDILFKCIAAVGIALWLGIQSATLFWIPMPF